MKRISVLLLILYLSLFSVAFTKPFGWEDVEKIFGKKGIVIGEIFKITFPRSDLKVTVSDVSVEPGLALTSWIGFQPMNQTTTIMGDLVLLESEVSSVMSKLVANGIKVTGLHNHLLGESPHVMYLHFFGQGDAVVLAHKMKTVLEVTKTPFQEIIQPTYALNWSDIESIIGRKGKAKGNLLQVSVPRTETITENGMGLPAPMGVASAINFQRVGNKVATTGDFVLVASEVNQVVKALTDHGIAVTAIHNHMLTETPRLFMLHFWGVNDSGKIAHGIKDALDEIHSKD